MKNQENSTWRSQAGYVWSLIGSAVGFANILSFSAHVYKNGGGAFLIPYCLALFLLGIPLLILEGLIGHRFKAPLVTAYGNVWGKIGKVFGWLAVMACLSIGGFYIVLTGYSVAYTYFSAMNAIPEDTKAFFLHSFLKVTPTIKSFGSLSLPIFLSTFAVGVATWFVLARNVRDGIEKICSIFMPILALIITFFAIVLLFVPGGLEGWVYYLKPNFSKLFDPLLWRDVFGQLFFSLSLGLGIIVGYSRHTGQTANIPRAMLYVALGDFAVSFISGGAIFACLAHISLTQNIPFNAILKNASTFEIGFVLFPAIIHFFGPILSQIIGVIFFFSIFIAGITGVFSIVESIAGNFEIEFKWTRKKAVTFALSAMMAFSFFFCMGNASHIMDAIEPMVVGTNMLIGGLALIMAFQYGCKEIRDCIGMRSPHGLCLRFVAPLFLAVILIGNLFQEFRSFDLAHLIRWMWFIFAIAAACVLSQVAKKEPLRINSEG